MTIITEAERWLRQLDRRSDKAVRELLRDYRTVERDLLDTIKRLEADMITHAEAADQALRITRFKVLLDQTQEEIGSLGASVADMLAGSEGDVSALGAQAGADLGVMVGGRAAALEQAFARLQLDTVVSASAFMQRGGALYNMLAKTYGTTWAQVIAERFVAGVARGDNPRTIARLLRSIISGALPSQLETIIRTAQLYSYRMSQIAVWQKSGVVDYWVWHAAIHNPRTCASCWAKHGKRFPVTQIMRDHHRGRCVQVPHTVALEGYPASDINIPTGESVFASLSPARQAAIAAAGKWGPQYRAWLAGRIKFDDLSRLVDDHVYGGMWTQASLSSIIGDAAKEFYAK